MYQYSKKKNESESGPISFHYKGLAFPRYEGPAPPEKGGEPGIYFAFYGKRFFPEKTIRYMVDLMIQQGSHAHSKAIL